MRKPRFMHSDTRAWERAANELARCYVEVIACADCGGPVVRTYCCRRCDSDNPEHGTRPKR